MTRVIISGGLGSLGNQLIERFRKTWDIGILDNDECRQWEVRTKYPDLDYYLGDVRDRDSLRPLKRYDLVIHAAALKRIEVCEANPWEAVKTNIIGTRNIIEACKDWGLDMVYISTDKSVKPINFYGMTKAVAERMCTQAHFNCVRYGNVFGSRGSIIPIFSKQRKEKKPITITHPDMTRFILTLDDALKLIETAKNAPGDGRVFVWKCKSSKVLDIANLFGKVEVIGAKIGEKLHETLITSDEMRRVVEGSDYYIVTEDILRDYLPSFNSVNAERIPKYKLKEMVQPWL